MPFVSPLALLGLLFVPAVIVMYLLKLRRDPAVVPSTLLWQRLVADVEANAPWQRLRRSLLLLVQLLLVIILALLAARPFVERPAGLAQDIVLVVDTSASMAATDVSPTRLEAAKQASIAALADLPSGGKVSVIAAGRTAKVVANGTSDIGRVKQAIASISQTTSIGDLGDALRLASALAARSGDAEIVIATDAALARPLTLPAPSTATDASPSASAASASTPATPTAAHLDAPVRVLQVGGDRKNQAIAALAVRTLPSGVSRSVFVSVANLDLERIERRVEVYGDGDLLEARDIYIDPQSRSDVSIDDVPTTVGVVEVRLASAGGDPDPDAQVAGDQLTVDDRAWAIVPPDRPRNVLIVGPGDPYLETALSYLPNVNLFGVKPDRYPSDAVRTDGTSWDLVIFDGVLPAELPSAPVLAIAPPKSSALGDVTGSLTNPGIGSIDPQEPILRYVDLSTVHIAEAKKLATPMWARSVIPGPAGAPLLYSGLLSGRPAAVLAFEPRRSDLPLQVAFPILLSNLTGELLGGAAAPTDSVAPGSPVTLAIPAGAGGVHVVRPDGSASDLVAGATDGSPTVTFSQTDLLGVYTVTPIAQPEASGSPPGRATASASPSASASASPSAPAVDPNAPVRFAVNLFDVDESTIAPGDAKKLEAIGKPAPAPGAGGQPGATPADDRPQARDELWIPVVLAALGFLVFEWAVYERDTLARLRRRLTARLGELRPARRGT